MMMLLLRPPAAPRGSATGSTKTGGIERSAVLSGVNPARAESSCARGAPSQRRRSAERPTTRWSAERPANRATRSRRLGGASAISFSRYSALGLTMALGRSGRTLVAAAAAPGARWEVWGIAKQAALKDQAKQQTALTSLAPNLRARVRGAADLATSVSRATHKQRQPLAPPGRRLAAGRAARFSYGVDAKQAASNDHASLQSNTLSGLIFCRFE